MRHALFPLLLLILASCSGCNQDIKPVDLLSGMDGQIPTLSAVMMHSTRSGTLLFDEDLASWSDFSSYPIPLEQVAIQGTAVTLVFREMVPPGSFVTVSGKVKDRSGNSTRFSTSLWGKNQNPATVLLSEFTTKGTEKNPDRVELYVTKSGNMGGIVITDETDRYVFPSLAVWAGEYLVVQFQQGTTTETHHSTQLAGLASNNGVIAVWTTPGSDAALMDAVTYSSITTTHDGWGNATVKEYAQEIALKGGWISAESTDAIPSTHLTATRSCNRKGTKDTNSREDWYVTTQGHATFGASNWEEVYQP
ncbi:MAG: hypothetical protein LKE39_06890 [Sphaerochaeta sp.]|jgi:hypothetical protein|nr:hypothetical protein [Sphaerochaeta sp.]MCH3920181.1 hypothetical protein [Sphaerochaeta sp.]MCI2045382.1 hypothetical protein [Sphaerochaeta sp.]MCI2076779.1 hypothetical protein [Sphaerochaeta sp.]MCI2096783.1 hypothetical protein [Sphaerochaeta sp.]